MHDPSVPSELDNYIYRVESVNSFLLFIGKPQGWASAFRNIQKGKGTDVLKPKFN